MNISNCNTYDIQNCGGNCYVCNVSTAEIERKYNIFPYCKGTQYCISKFTQCNDNIYFDNCIVSNTLIKVTIGILIILFYIGAYSRMLTTFRTYNYNKTKQCSIILLYSIFNLIIPLILISLTYIIYLEYFIVCFTSFILTCCCIPKLKRNNFLLNRNYNPYSFLSDNLPITPSETSISTLDSESINSESINSELINSIQNVSRRSITSVQQEEPFVLPPAYADLENNMIEPTIQSQT